MSDGEKPQFFVAKLANKDGLNAPNEAGQWGYAVMCYCFPFASSDGEGEVCMTPISVMVSKDEEKARSMAQTLADTLNFAHYTFFDNLHEALNAGNN